jgi:GAF domain-containing protein
VISASVVLFLLVIARMAGLVRTQEQSAARERALREAGLALVTATNRDAIHGAAIEAARTLAGTEAAVRFCEVVDDAPDDLVVVAANGGGADVLDVHLSLSVLQEWKRQRLMDRDAYVVRTYESTLLDPLSLPADPEGSVLVAPIFLRDEFRGMMVVATPQEMPSSVADSLQALSSQVALALESAALTEDLLIQQSEAQLSLIGGTVGANIVIDNNEIVARNNGAASSLFLNTNSGDVVIGWAIDIGYEIVGVQAEVLEIGELVAGRGDVSADPPDAGAAL